MILSDIIFFGWYHILDKTIYSAGTEKGSIGPKAHSFFITFLFHGINLWTLLSFLTAYYFKIAAPLYVSLSLAILVFVVGYLFYYRRKAEKVMALSLKSFRTFLFVLIALSYVVVSVYLMFKVGDYVRYQLGN